MLDKKQSICQQIFKYNKLLQYDNSIELFLENQQNVCAHSIAYYIYALLAKGKQNDFKGLPYIIAEEIFEKYESIAGKCITAVNWYFNALNIDGNPQPMSEPFEFYPKYIEKFEKYEYYVNYNSQNVSMYIFSLSLEDVDCSNKIIDTFERYRELLNLESNAIYTYLKTLYARKQDYYKIITVFNRFEKELHLDRGYYGFVYQDSTLLTFYIDSLNHLKEYNTIISVFQKYIEPKFTLYKNGFLHINLWLPLLKVFKESNSELGRELLNKYTDIICKNPDGVSLYLKSLNNDSLYNKTIEIFRQYRYIYIQSQSFIEILSYYILAIKNTRQYELIIEEYNKCKNILYEYKISDSLPYGHLVTKYYSIINNLTDVFIAKNLYVEIAVLFENIINSFKFRHILGKYLYALNNINQYNKVIDIYKEYQVLVSNITVYPLSVSEKNNDKLSNEQFAYALDILTGINADDS